MCHRPTDFQHHRSKEQRLYRCHLHVHLISVQLRANPLKTVYCSNIVDRVRHESLLHHLCYADAHIACPIRICMCADLALDALRASFALKKRTQRVPLQCATQVLPITDPSLACKTYVLQTSPLCILNGSLVVCSLVRCLCAFALEFAHPSCPDAHCCASPHRPCYDC